MLTLLLTGISVFVLVHNIIQENYAVDYLYPALLICSYVSFPPKFFEKIKILGFHRLFPPGPKTMRYGDFGNPTHLGRFIPGGRRPRILSTNTARKQPGPGNFTIKGAKGGETNLGWTVFIICVEYCLLRVLFDPDYLCHSSVLC